jgi:nitrogen-specific signal transduction histidine kinase/ActR/RegA family two-component response regulator
VTGTVGLARDITDRKRTEEQRLRLERQMQEMQKLESLGVLAGGIAHDFNNLLVGVLANAELALQMLSREPGSSAMHERISDIRQAALHAAELTNQMLAYSGRGHFDVRPISMNEMILSMQHLLSASICKKAEVIYELSSDLPAVQADVAQMRQVIMNLIVNASDALEDRPGVIRVRTGAKLVSDSIKNLYGPLPLTAGSYAFLEVADDGSGMDDETKARLFEPFFTTKLLGRGLGLSAVQGIVRGHGGGIALESAKGHGTTITLLLPCSDRPPTRTVRTAPEASAAWSGSGVVLLVDDDARVRLVTELVLKSIGFEVLAAASGHEALQAFDQRTDEVRLAMLDLTMPDLGGDQVMKLLREQRPELPVLLCSGYSEEEMSSRCRREALTSFLQKPYPVDLLRARLKDLLEPTSEPR